MDEASKYPRTYRYGWGWGALTVLLGLFFLCLSAGLFFVLPKDDIYGLVLLVSSESLTTFAGLYCVIGVFRSYLTLYEDHLEFQGVYRKHIIRRDDIRAITPPMTLWDTTALNILPLSPAGQYVTITNYTRQDEIFLTWFDGIPREELPE